MGRKGSHAAAKTLLSLGCIDDSIPLAVLRAEIRDAIMNLKEGAWRDRDFVTQSDARNNYARQSLRGWQLFDTEKTKRLTVGHDVAVCCVLSERWSIRIEVNDPIYVRITAQTDKVWRRLRKELLYKRGRRHDQQE